MVGAHALTCVKEFSRVVNTKLGSRCSEESVMSTSPGMLAGGTLTAIALGKNILTIHSSLSYVSLLP